MLPPQRSVQGYENPKSCGDVIEAHLAAANASSRLLHHFYYPAPVPWCREYEDLEGGTFTSTDEIARFINEWMKKYHAKLPPRQRSKSLKRHSNEIGSGVLPQNRISSYDSSYI